MKDTNLVEAILKRPDAALQLEYFQKVMSEEKARRKAFYEWVTEDVKAEFINGEVVVHSPVKRRHWDANDLLSSLLSFYVRIRKLGRIGTEKVMISLTRNDYEPDLVFFSQEKIATFGKDQVLFPAPDFIVEILSPSTAKNDKTTKKEDYALHGVAEYWIVDPQKQQIDQYILSEGSTDYFPAKTHQLGQTIRSTVIKGFKMEVAAIFDEATNLAAMQALAKKSSQ
ncbi:MAG: Uma2 family endonuclease [Bacteroidota bacterium]